MTQNDPLHDDQPLSPEQERIVQRIRRMSAFSALVMMAGVASVFAVIGYRLYIAPSAVTAPRASWIDRIRLPEGVEPVTAHIEGNRLTVTVRRNAALEILLYDLASGRQLERVVLEVPQ